MTRSVGSEQITGGIRVQVTPAYLPAHSNPSHGRYVFGYRIRITNQSERPATLVSRWWLIVDAEGVKREVRGDGVVGQQPRLEPGDSYEYESSCPLPSRWGTMEGTYSMLDDEGVEFPISVARFYLIGPSHEPETANVNDGDAASDSEAGF